MIKIAIIDDKSYGIPHVQELHEHEEFELAYFDTFAKFKLSKKKFDIVYLDYFLDKDGITGDTVIPQIKKQTNKIVGFSSVASCSQKLKQAGADDFVVKIAKFT
jgi:DNA-binding response OmpR family regulator